MTLKKMIDGSTMNLAMSGGFTRDAKFPTDRKQVIAKRFASGVASMPIEEDKQVNNSRVQSRLLMFLRNANSES